MESTQGGTTGNFDFNAMDFSGFAMPQQQEFLKTPEEGNTSGGFFFGDEGIDTSGTSFGQQSLDSIFAPSGTGFDMQSLNMDNTMGSTWNDPFPSTPAQSFDTIYNPQFSSTLGKRPLQLDVQDFPQSKRHESVVPDLPTFSPFPSSASVTGSSWAIDTQPTPASSTEVGLSDDAADVCATWFSKYNMLPSDRHIESLSQLTGESASAIRHWFGQALKQGMTGHDSAYKSQTNFTQQEPLVGQLPQQVAATTTTDVPCNHDTQTSTTGQSPLRGGKKGCNPTDDPELLRRDPNKIYQCTRKCGKRYGRKCDWKRNEEEGYPSKSWICSLCKSQGVERVKPCFRKYHFSQHFRNIHPGLNCADYEEASLVQSDTSFPRKCGFCPHRFTSRQDRIDHIADHFKKGKCMLDWNDDEDDNHGSDNMDDDDDDNDDRPNSGGSGNSKPFYPPNQEPRGGAGPKFNGDGSGSGGTGYDGQQPQSGFFNFSLSQLNGGDIGGQSSCDGDKHIKSSTSQSPTEQPLPTDIDEGAQRSIHGHSPLAGRHDAAKGDHQESMAGDAFAKSLIQEQPEKQNLKGLEYSPSTSDVKGNEGAIELPEGMCLDPYVSDDATTDAMEPANPTKVAASIKPESTSCNSLTRLLSIDDGGIRGLSTLIILQRLIETLGKEEQQKTNSHGSGHDQGLDLLYGTSTGGLIAILLTRLNLNVEQARSVYQTLGKGIFGHKSGRVQNLRTKVKNASKPSLLSPNPPSPLPGIDNREQLLELLKGVARKYDTNELVSTLLSQDTRPSAEDLVVSAFVESVLTRTSTPTSWKVSEHSLLAGSITDSNVDALLLSDEHGRELCIPIESALDTGLQELKSFTTLLDSQSFLSVKLLGTGGFSTVDEVVHRETSLRISRKTLKNREQSALEELKKEVNVLQKLRHPHIIRYLGAYSKGDKMSILMSPVAETTLDGWLDKVNVLRPQGLSQTIVKMLGCLASSIRYLHEQRPVVKHMDIKPANILVTHGDQEFPHVVLSDFGISSSEEATTTGRLKPLTRQYCAPEVPEGISREQAADIWSLGCVFAEMASIAFREDNPHWLEFRRQFNGREGKYYWQNVSGLHDYLTRFFTEATSSSEVNVVRTVKSMLNAEPAERPTAASLTLIFTPAPCCLSWPNEKASYPGPTEELRTVEMFVREDGVDCRAHVHVHTSSDTASKVTKSSGGRASRVGLTSSGDGVAITGTEDEQNRDAFSRAKSWLEECSHEHEACRREPTALRSLPTRLVDIQPNGAVSSVVRIVDSSQLNSGVKPVSYAALSYVWGEVDIVTLSTDNLHEMQGGLPLEALPKAINEAIAAANRVGYRYIWVDSLCILQDSPDDVERECARMASVYRDASLTIVLDQLKETVDAQTSPNQDRTSGSTNAVSWQSLGKTIIPRQITASASLPAIDFITPAFGWDTRAWALQERLLSRRLLILGEEQMYWECNALKASETFPRGLPSLLWEKVHTTPCAEAQPSHVKCEPHAGTKSAAADDVAAQIFHVMNTRPLKDQQWIKKEEEGLRESMIDTIDNVKSKIHDSARRDADHKAATYLRRSHFHVGGKCGENSGGNRKALSSSTVEEAKLASHHAEAQPYPPSIMLANPPHGPDSNRTPISSNASFIEPWGYPSRSPTSATSTMAYTWTSNDNIDAEQKARPSFLAKESTAEEAKLDSPSSSVPEVAECHFGVHSALTPREQVICDRDGGNDIFSLACVPSGGMNGMDGMGGTASGEAVGGEGVVLAKCEGGDGMDVDMV